MTQDEAKSIKDFGASAKLTTAFATHSPLSLILWHLFPIVPIVN